MICAGWAVLSSCTGDRLDFVAGPLGVGVGVVLFGDAVRGTAFVAGAGLVSELSC